MLVRIGFIGAIWFPGPVTDRPGGTNEVGVAGGTCPENLRPVTSGDIGVKGRTLLALTPDFGFTSSKVRSIWENGCSPPICIFPAIYFTSMHSLPNSTVLSAENRGSSTSSSVLSSRHNTHQYQCSPDRS